MQVNLASAKIILSSQYLLQLITNYNLRNDNGQGKTALGRLTNYISHYGMRACSIYDKFAFNVTLAQMYPVTLKRKHKKVIFKYPTYYGFRYKR